jgi:Uma2 family endonuclease
MSSERRGKPPTWLDPALLVEHPELAVLTLDLPDSDGEPMENERERFQMLLLLDTLEEYWHGRQDFYAAGNMFVYYCAEQAREILAEEAEPTRPRRAFRGPDLFVVLNVDGSFRRQKWVVWDEEGHYPDVIFEFLSPSTRRTDQTTKKTLYEQIFKTREYYWYDPFDPREFRGWQLHPGNGYQAMTPDARGWIWSPTLHLWIGRWEGTYRGDQTTWLRCYDPQGRLVLTSQETAEAERARAEVAQQRAEVAQQQAEVAQQQAEAERARAEAAQQQAEAERARAAAAEAELAHLRADLARLREERR